MRRAAQLGIAIGIAVAVMGCFDPHDQRPGTFLSGEVAATPSDWSFTNDHELIAIEVQTPYLLPHSVTIWCAALDGHLYVGAREPETKRWPGWVDRKPDVRLRIGPQVFEVRLAPLEDPQRITRLQAAYAAKYDLPPRTADSPPIRYWLVEARS